MESKDEILNDLRNIPIDISALVSGTIASFILCGIGLAIWFLLSRGLNSLHRNNHLSRQMLLPFRLILRYGIIFGIIVLGISAYGIPIGNFWTLISTILGLIAIGFVAVWSVLSNISSTFFLLGFKPFQIGDYIVVVGDEISGQVVDLNFMFTTLRRENGDLFKIPNNQFFQKATLRPGDGGKSEESEKEKDTTDKTPPKANHDHANANLEGIEDAPGKSSKSA